MSLIHLEDENFDKLISNKCIVDFYANWCSPCKIFAKTFEEVALNSDINFVKVDVDKHEDLARIYGVMSIPTIIMFENGDIVEKHIGILSKDELLELINK